MFDHVTIRAADLAASRRFYETVLGAAGIERSSTGEYVEWDDFSLAAATAGRPPTQGLHIGFAVAGRERVDAFWRAGVDAGHADDGPPGERPVYTPDYFGAFLRDPDGNSAEAVHYDGVNTEGNVDHLWIRVADVAAARRFYQVVAPPLGLRLTTDTPGRVSFERISGTGGSFSLVAGEQLSRNVHLAFPVADEDAVAAFHAAAIGAGHRDEGAPGERPEYHSGYYAAFVLDPDGHNVEAVVHRR